jgi:hypothetical protein
MIYPDATLDEWLKKTGLEVVSYTCASCLQPQTTTIPVLTSDCYGLETPDHGCPLESRGIVLVPRTPDSIAIWQDLARFLSQNQGCL